jgi:uncharacterized protein YjdB
MDSLEKKTPEECAAIRSFVFKEGSKVDSITIRVIKEKFPLLERLDLSAADYSDNTNQEKVIPPYLFAHWYNLKAIALPHSIKGIGEGAFYASGLVDVIHIPASVKKLGMGPRKLVHFDEEDNTIHGVFENCSLLRGVIFDEENGVSELEEIGIKTFSRCVNLAGTLHFPASLKKIQPMAFYHCRSLERIDLPSGLVSLGDEWMALDTTRKPFGADEWERSHCGTVGAFSGCTGLSGNLTIPNGITFIPNGTFANCSSLNGILSIPSSVVVIGASAFDNCTGLRSDDSLDLTNVKHIGMGAFRNCHSLEGPLIFPDSPEIGCAAFTGCHSLEGILPEKLDTKGQVIGTSGSADGFRTIKEKEELDDIWGDYDFSVYYPEDAFKDTPFDGGKTPKGVYVRPEHGNDNTGDGSSWSTAFRSLEQALKTLKDSTHWGRLIFIEETKQIVRFNSTVSFDVDGVIIQGGYRSLGNGQWDTSPQGEATTLRSNGPYPVFRITENVKELTLENLVIDGFETDDTLDLTSKGSVLLLNSNFKETVYLHKDFTFDGTLTIGKHLFHEDGIVSFQWVNLNISDSLQLSFDGFAVIEKLILPWLPCDSFIAFTVERPQGNILNESVLDEHISMMVGSYDVPHADFLWKPVVNGEEGLYRLSVSAEIKLRELTVSPVSPTLASGGHTLQLKLSSEIPSIFRLTEIEWISDLPLVVEVDEHGLLTSGTDPGIATVTAIVRLPSAIKEEQGKEIGRIEVSVYVFGIVPAPHRATVSLHDSIQLDATVYPSYLPDVELVWTSDNLDIATVNNTGLVQTYGQSGDVLITATVKGYASGTATFPLKVAQLTNTILLTPSVVGKIKTGFIVDFIARCLPEDVENRSVEWTILDTHIADFLAHSDTSCRIKAKEAGSTVLCVKALDGSNTEIRYVLDVLAASSTNTILLSPSISGKIETGFIIDFVAHRLPENIENRSVEWTILDTHIADFLAHSDTSCRIKAKEAGSTVLYVKALDGSEVEVHYLLNVFGNPPTSLASVTVLPIRVHYEEGTLYLKGLNGHHGQILTVEGVVKADFRVYGDEVHQTLILPAGIYLFRTTDKVDFVHKFVVK